MLLLKKERSPDIQKRKNALQIGLKGLTKINIEMSKKVSIKITEAQPLPCPYCGGFYGYQYSDLFRMSYTSVHTSDGTYSGGEYSDGVSLNKGKLAYCVNCGTRLPFTLIREGGEQIE